MVETITDSFHDDPTWAYAFNDPAARPGQYRRWWRLMIEGSLRYDASWVADGGASTAVWIPPGGTEWSEEQLAQVEPLLHELLGDRAELVIESLAAFDEVHPLDEPHYYLTLLGTRSDRRGEGLGMALLRHCLELIDAEHAPAYLESSNPANDKRYESVGFQRIGGFAMPGGGPWVAAMWRPARG
jgi:GNAT superfamily N-acetyltransferase